MPSIDERIVSMVFENAKFEAGVAHTMKSLSKLDTTLQQIGAKNSIADIEKAANKVTLQQPMSALDKLKTRLFGAGQGATQGMNDIERAGEKVQLEQPIKALNKVQSETAQVGAHAAQGFSEIERASGRVSLQGLNSALDSVTAKFSILQGAAAVALGNITTQAISRGTSFAKSFAFGPLMQGLDEYKTNLGSIQTILANTEGQQVSGLKAVNQHLQELNKYSDQTIYNFSQMAKNIGTFTAAGVDLPTATASIKGIANLAALSGSSSQQASTAMYQLSQAIAAGRVSLQDWNSVVNAGMGGAKFQQALMRTAETMGSLEQGAVKVDKATGKATVNGQSFRESIMAAPGKESWLTSEVLTSTLSQFTGDLSAAELKAQGFTDAQTKAIMQTAKTAKAAATEVKTLPQVFEVAREAIGSGWAKTFQHIFGNFKEAKKTFTELSNFINEFIGRTSDARNKILADWKKLGGREDLLKGLRNAFDALMSVIRPIKEAFREIFPAKTAEDLADFTKRFRGFMDRLKIGPETAENLKRTFKGLFALLDIGKEIVFGIFRGFTRMLGVVSDGSGGVLAFSGSVGDFLVAVRDWLKEGDRLKNFFESVADVLATPLELISKLTNAISDLFTGEADADGTASSLNEVTEALKPAERLAQQAKKAWEGFLRVIEKIGNILDPVVDKIGDAFSALGQAVSDALEGENFDSLFAGIQTAFIGGIFLSIKKALGGGLGFNFAVEAKGLSDALDVVSGSLKSMQTNLKANTLLQIAAALALLSASVVALSFVEPEKIASSMTAMAVGLGQLIGAMALLAGTGGGKFGSLKLPVIAASLVVLSTAIGILAASVMLLSRLSWEEIAKGLVAVDGLLGILTLAATGLAKVGPTLLITGPALIAIGIALNILAGAMKIFASMSWEDMAKGLVGVSGILLVIGAVVNLAQRMPAAVLLIGPALIAIGTGLGILAGVMKIFGSMDWGTLGKGLLAITAALVAIGLAMGAMPPTLPLTAAGLILVGIALAGIAGTVAILGNMDVGTLAKGIGAIAGALGVLAVGLTAMILALPGAAALLVAASALAILAPTLAILGTMSMATIATGLGVIAASLIVISTAGMVAAPGLLILGGALSVLGLGVALVGGGVYALAKGLQILASDGSKGVAIVIAALTGLVAIMPKIVVDFLKGLIEIAKGISQIAPSIVQAMVKIGMTILDGVIKLAPKFAQAATVLISSFLKILAVNAGPIIAAGFRLLNQLLTGIANNIGRITNTVGTIVVRFLKALANQMPRLVAAGARVLVRFLQGIAENIGSVVRKGGAIISAIVRGMGNNLSKLVTAGANAIIKFVEGVGNNIEKIANAGVRIAGRLIRALSNALLRLIHVGARAVINFLNGVADAIRKYGPELRMAGWNIADAIIDGIVGGFGELGHKAVNAVKDLAGSMIDKAKGVFDILSPSKVFAQIGRFTVLGLAQGIENNGGHAEKTMAQAGADVITAARSAMSDVSGILSNVVDLDPVISPVLDLSAVQKEAQNVPKLASVMSISADSSVGQATAISQEKAEADAMLAEAVAAASKPSVSFEQNNYSPESLSTAEIYRRSNNQFSKVKAELGLND